MCIISVIVAIHEWYQLISEEEEYYVISDILVEGRSIINRDENLVWEDSICRVSIDKDRNGFTWITDNQWTLYKTRVQRACAQHNAIT